MVKRVLLVTIVVFFLGCKKEKTNEFPFDSFAISSYTRHETNSIKFTKSDTVYLQKRFPAPQENFYAIIQDNEKSKLIRYLHFLNLEKFKSVYVQEKLFESETYLINLSNKEKRKSISIYGSTAPKEFYTFIDSLEIFKKNLKFLPTKKIIDFGDLGSIVPPPPPIKQTE
jgi:hypothetical protein